MKKLFLIIMLLLSLSMFGQSDCLKFLGIPVDGTKEEMVRQLQHKGYTLQNFEDIEFLEGEFNGHNVHIYINTNKGNVDRIYVAFQNMQNEAGIITQFNNLQYDFNKSDKYSIDLYHINEYIPTNEDISYEMAVHNKKYVAIFHQKFTENELSILKETIQENYDGIEANLKENRSELTDLIINNDTLTIEQKAEYLAKGYNITNAMKNEVWFTIEEYKGKYYIALFYDNLYNRPNGEDL